jgi:hypothetical protein
MPQEALSRLHQALETMNVPAQKKSATEMQDLRWLGRNIAMQNANHPQFKVAAGALEELGVTFVLGI